MNQRPAGTRATSFNSIVRIKKSGRRLVHRPFDAVQSTALATCFDHVNRQTSRARSIAPRVRMRRRAIRTRRRTRDTKSCLGAAPAGRQAASLPALAPSAPRPRCARMRQSRSACLRAPPAPSQKPFSTPRSGQARGVHGVLAEIPGRRQHDMRADSSIVACDGREMHVLADRQSCENRSDARAWAGNRIREHSHAQPVWMISLVLPLNINGSAIARIALPIKKTR